MHNFERDRLEDGFRQLMEVAGLDEVNEDKLAVEGLGMFYAAYKDPTTGNLPVEQPAEVQVAHQDQSPLLVNELSPREGDRLLVAQLITYYGVEDNRHTLLEPMLQSRLGHAFEVAQKHKKWANAPLLEKLVLQVMALGVKEGRNPGYRSFAQLKQAHSERVEDELSDVDFETVFARAMRLLNTRKAVRHRSPPPSAPKPPESSKSVAQTALCTPEAPKVPEVPSVPEGVTFRTLVRSRVYYYTDGSVQDKRWRKKAACSDSNTDDFYAEAGSNNEESLQHVIAICRSCEVWNDCLTTALSSQEEFGVWGATTERQRRRIVDNMIQEGVLDAKPVIKETESDTVEEEEL